MADDKITEEFEEKSIKVPRFSFQRYAEPEKPEKSKKLFGHDAEDKFRQEEYEKAVASVKAKNRALKELEDYVNKSAAKGLAGKNYDEDSIYYNEQLLPFLNAIKNGQVRDHNGAIGSRIRSFAEGYLPVGKKTSEALKKYLTDDASKQEWSDKVYGIQYLDGDERKYKVKKLKEPETKEPSTPAKAVVAQKQEANKVADNKEINNNINDDLPSNLTDEEQQKLIAEKAANVTKGIQDVYGDVDVEGKKWAPSWFWKEVNDPQLNLSKAQKGYLIFNHIASSLGATANGIANSWDGGNRDVRNNSYINQYRNAKLAQLIENRKQMQQGSNETILKALNAAHEGTIDTLALYGRIRNAKAEAQFNRLNAQEKATVLSMLADDTKGIMTDAAIGQLISMMLQGKAVSANDVASGLVVGGAVDAGAKDFVSELFKGAGNFASQFSQKAFTGWK